MAQFDKTFPTLDCSACILTPKMSEVGQHDKVTMYTYSELEEVSGSVGNFKVKIRKKARMVNDRDLHRLRHLRGEVPAEGGGRRFRGRHGQSQGDLHALPAGRAADSRDRHGQLHLVHPRQVPGLREGLPHQRHRLRRRKTRSSSSRWATSSWPPAGSSSIAAAAAIRLRAAGQRLHEHGVRAALQRGRPDQRQDRAPRRQDRAQERWPSSTASAAATRRTTVLLERLLHGGA